MADSFLPPILIKPIPAQVVNEGGSYHPLNLKKFIQSPNVESGAVRFMAELSDGRPLPQGLICTGNGIVSGIPARGTQGEYECVVIAENDSGVPFVTQFSFLIRPRMAVESDEIVSQLKGQIWDAIEKNLPFLDLEASLQDLLNRPITKAEIYYLLERFAALTIWDVYNLDFPGEKREIQLDGMSEHYHVYDRGSCLIAAPKDLFSHARTLEDALQTARVVAQEVYRRGWFIEFAGHDKMVRAAWVELRLLADKHGKQLEILHFSPSMDDIKLYAEKSQHHLDLNL